MTNEPQWDGDEQATLFRARVAEHDAAHPGYGRAWAAFEARLLEHGGRLAVARPDPEQLLGVLVQEGTVFDGSSAILDDSLDEDCHRNAATLWRTGHCDAIGTGYALSVDGLWREHSWAVRDDQIVETTEPRLKYFGLVMTADKATWFADWVSPP
jgi:hypothetical protein